MNTPKILSILAFGLLLVAGTASALASTSAVGREIGTGPGADVAGLASVDAGAYGNADASGAMKAADDAKFYVAETAKATIDSAVAASGELQAKGVKKADMSVDASSNAGADLLAGIKANIEAFGGWLKSLWIEPSVDHDGGASATAVGDIVADATSMDGSLDLDVVQDLESTAHADYNLPPPPKPTTGFLSSVKMAFESFLQIE